MWYDLEYIYYTDEMRWLVKSGRENYFTNNYSPFSRLQSQTKKHLSLSDDNAFRLDDIDLE